MDNVTFGLMFASAVKRGNTVTPADNGYGGAEYASPSAAALLGGTARGSVSSNLTPFGEVHVFGYAPDTDATGILFKNFIGTPTALVVNGVSYAILELTDLSPNGGSYVGWWLGYVAPPPAMVAGNTYIWSIT